MVLEKTISKIVEGCMEEKNYDVFSQVPLKTRKIDLICIPHERKDIIAIEVKVKNWRKAFQQASIYRLCADKVYVALWHEFAHRAKIELFKKNGMGLIKVGNSIQIVQPAGENSLVQPSLKEEVQNYVLKDSYQVRL